MNIDMAALHAIEVDRGIPAGELLDTIKSALLTAYRHTAGHQAEAAIDIDAKTGEVKVMARELDEDGNLVSEWDDTPEGFGRVAATTARQVMLQRFRDAENEKIYGEFAAREGDIVAGVIQQNARANALGEEAFVPPTETQSLATFGLAQRHFGQTELSVGLRGEVTRQRTSEVIDDEGQLRFGAAAKFRIFVDRQ